MRRPNIHSREQAVTLTELLLVLLIVSLLATLAIPTVTRRARDARIAAAEADAKALADAQMACGLIHGYFVPLQLLDDVPRNNDTESDDIANAVGDSIFVTNINRPVLSQLSTQQTVELADLDDTWEGPFYQAQRVYIFDPEDAFAEESLENDFPLDPWGRPYFLYSPLGVVGSTAGSLAQAGTFITPEIVTTNRDGLADGNLTSNNDRFDRWAIVSFGPDGQAGDFDLGVTELGDDIVYFFGGDAGTTGSV